MLKKASALLRNRVLIYTLVGVGCLLNGIVQVAVLHDTQLGLGDTSTFYAFARNIAEGEVMYKDFIHFRTPGSVGFFGLVMSILGQEQTTIYIASMLETVVLYPLLFVVSAMILFRKRNPWFVVVAFMGIALLPGIAQLRSGFGLLTIAIYTLTFSETKRRKLLLVLTGLLAVVTFIFGQEVALMVGLCLAAAELFHRVDWRKRWDRIKYLGAGIVAGLVPLLVYIAIFSNLWNFLYYTLYYAFIRQPQFMDLPFPDFGYNSFVYYLPFIIYLLCFLALYTNKKLGIADGIVLSFGILRLITAVGRSDFGHLIFSIPEIFIIVPYLLIRSRESNLTNQVLKQWLPFGVALALLLYLATHDGIALVAVPFVVLFALYRRRIIAAVNLKTIHRNFPLYLSLGVTFVLFVYILTPTYLGIARSVKAEYFTDDRQAYRIGGMKTDEITYKQITAVQEAVQAIGPKTIFSFPIQPFYYSLAEHHASRFLTFEPQTTVAEQEKTIDDLRRTKPEVIIFDPLQAHGLSASLWKISEYITTHYEIKKEIVSREILWVMVPKATTQEDEKLVFQLYKYNKKDGSIGIQNTAMGLQNAIGQTSRELQFRVNPDSAASVIKISVQAPDGHASCGIVELYKGAQQVQKIRVCATDGEMTIPLEGIDESSKLVLQNESDKPLIWNNPRVTVPSSEPASE